MRRRLGLTGAELLNHFFPKFVPEFRRDHNHDRPDSVPEDEIERQLYRLRCAERDVSKELRAGTDPRVHYPGECYFRAYRYATDLALRQSSERQIWVVHGEYGYSLGHAWVELPRDVLFDPVLQRFYEKLAYYAIQMASPRYKYSAQAAMLIRANMPQNSSGVWRAGAWHEVLKLPLADPNNPTVIDFERAAELLVTSGLRPDLAKPSKKTRSPTKRGRSR